MTNKHKDYTHQIFDRLTAVRFSHRQKGHTFWLFECWCGTQLTRSIQGVKTNKYNACPTCLKGAGSHAWQGTGKIPQDLLTTIKHSAIARNLEFNITTTDLSELWNKQAGRCALTGWPIELHKSYKEKTQRTASLDRIDPKLGYVRGNIQWVHRDVNYAKRHMTQEEFINLCQAVISLLVQRC